ncbi:5'-nucleotidase [Bradyrhizobium sp. USDA 4341]
MSRLVIAVSSRALFDLEEAHQIFAKQGVAAYQTHAASAVLPKPGAAYPIVEAIARAGANAKASPEILIFSRDSASSAIPVVRAIEEAGLGAARGVFTGGAPSMVPYLQAFAVDLFLTKNASDAEEATAAGIPAALMFDPPETFDPKNEAVVRIAFDGDAVLFSDQADLIFAQHGLDHFQDHERRNADVPLPPGPLAPFLSAIYRFQEAAGNGHKIFRIALITARAGACRTRALNTLTSWGVQVDEAYFCGDAPKAKFVELFRPHLFFDDKTYNLELSAKVAPSARVPSAESDAPGLVDGMKP